MAGPVTKAAWRVTRAAELPRALADAFDTATSGRMGPVLLDIPMDVQRQEVADSSAGSRGIAERRASDEQVAEVATAVASAERPLILAGGGASTAAEAVRSLAHVWGVPVVSSLLGLDMLPADDPLRVGFIGTYGNRWANQALGEADLLLALGTRLDIRQTGADVAPSRRARPSSASTSIRMSSRGASRRRPYRRRRGRLGSQLLSAPAPGRDWSAWRGRSRRRPRTGRTRRSSSTCPASTSPVLHALSAAGREAVAYVADVGREPDVGRAVSAPDFRPALRHERRDGRHGFLPCPRRSASLWRRRAVPWWP